VPPVYAPEVVADVILHAAQHPLRELIAGGSGAKLSAARFAPRLADKYMERWTFDSQNTDRRAGPDRPDNLYEPLPADGGERGANWTGHTRGSSVYTKAMLHPLATAGVVAAAAVGISAWLAGLQRGGRIDRLAGAGYPEPARFRGSPSI
jgi:hypothetical protein